MDFLTQKTESPRYTTFCENRFFHAIHTEMLRLRKSCLDGPLNNPFDQNSKIRTSRMRIEYYVIVMYANLLRPLSTAFISASTSSGKRRTPAGTGGGAR